MRLMGLRRPTPPPISISTDKPSRRRQRERLLDRHAIVQVGLSHQPALLPARLGLDDAVDGLVLLGLAIGAVAHGTAIVVRERHGRAVLGDAQPANRLEQFAQQFHPLLARLGIHSRRPELAMPPGEP